MQAGRLPVVKVDALEHHQGVYHPFAYRTECRSGTVLPRGSYRYIDLYAVIIQNDDCILVLDFCLQRIHLAIRAESGHSHFLGCKSVRQRYRGIGEQPDFLGQWLGCFFYRILFLRIRDVLLYSLEESRFAIQRCQIELQRKFQCCLIPDRVPNDLFGSRFRSTIPIIHGIISQ